MIQMVIYFQMGRKNGERKNCCQNLWFFFSSPLLPFCQESLITGKKNFLGIGYSDGMFLLISKGSSLFLLA